tara:strand:+ start:485 stop:1264 length:780 start_codon:yes stop_codon:yes gene_type:complete
MFGDLMSDSKNYYDDLISQGYSESQALEFTKQYFPKFTLENSNEDQNIDSGKIDAESVVAALIDVLNLKDQNNKKNRENTSQQESKFKIMLSYFEAFIHIILEPFSDKKNRLIALGVISLILLSIIAFNIPKTQEPLIGTWVKSDGQELIFNEDNSYDDGMMYISIWSLNGNSLMLNSTGEWTLENGNSESYNLTQMIRISFTDDEEGIWIKWDKILLNSQNEDVPINCSLIIKESLFNNNDDFSYYLEEYEDEKPTWC